MLAMSKGATVFVNYLASTYVPPLSNPIQCAPFRPSQQYLRAMLTEVVCNRANENAASSGRKTISPQDVLKALDDLEFGDFKPRLEAELASSFPLFPSFS